MFVWVAAMPWSLLRFCSVSGVGGYIFSEYYSIKKQITYAGLKYDLGSCEFFFSSKQLSLSKSNKHILLIFLTYREKLVTKQYLHWKLWWNNNLEINNLRIKILRLKKELKPYDLDQWLHTVRGEWYILRSSNFS